MKKFFALILALAMVLALCACGSKSNTPAADENAPVQESEQLPTIDDTDTSAEPSVPTAKPNTGVVPSKPPTATANPNAGATTAAKTADQLKTLMTSVVAGADEIRSASCDEVSKDNDSYKFNLGIDYVTGYEAVTYQSMIGSYAYQIALVSVPSSVSAADVAAQMKSGVNPAKWVCVQADAVGTAVNGNVILLYMVDTETFPNTVDVITANFAKLAV